MSNKTKNIFLWTGIIILAAAFGELINSVINPSQTPIWLGIRAIIDKDGKTISSAKTLWDLADLLIMPFVLAVVAYLFNRADRQREEKKIDERNQEESLKQYVEQMSKLMLEHNLLVSQEKDPVRNVARTLTRIALFSVNKIRKGIVIRFLKEADLINEKKFVISLAGIDFRDTDLHRAGLQNLDFTNTNFIGANFDEASLEGTSLANANFSQSSLKNTNLKRANLKETNFSDADLSQANLDESKLIKANLKGATLKGAKLRGDLTGIKLENAIYDKDTKWPEGFDPRLAGARLTE